MSDDGFTPDQRVALRILHEEYTDLTHAERAKAFNAAFADELRKRGWPSGRKAPEQRAHYRTNDQPSHANLWNNLHRGPGYKNGRSLHRKVSARIKEAVKVTGMLPNLRTQWPGYSRTTTKDKKRLPKTRQREGFDDDYMKRQSRGGGTQNQASTADPFQANNTIQQPSNQVPAQSISTSQPHISPATKATDELDGAPPAVSTAQSSTTSSNDLGLEQSRGRTSLSAVATVIHGEIHFKETGSGLHPITKASASAKQADGVGRSDRQTTLTSDSKEGKANGAPDNGSEEHKHVLKDFPPSLVGGGFNGDKRKRQADFACDGTKDDNSIEGASRPRKKLIRDESGKLLLVEPDVSEAPRVQDPQARSSFFARPQLPAPYTRSIDHVPKMTSATSEYIPQTMGPQLHHAPLGLQSQFDDPHAATTEHSSVGASKNATYHTGQHSTSDSHGFASMNQHSSLNLLPPSYYSSVTQSYASQNQATHHWTSGLLDDPRYNASIASPYPMGNSSIFDNGAAVYGLNKDDAQYYNSFAPPPPRMSGDVESLPSSLVGNDNMTPINSTDYPLSVDAPSLTASTNPGTEVPPHKATSHPARTKLFGDAKKGSAPTASFKPRTLNSNNLSSSHQVGAATLSAFARGVGELGVKDDGTAPASNEAVQKFKAIEDLDYGMDAIYQ